MLTKTVRLLAAGLVFGLAAVAAPAAAEGENCHYELICDDQGNCEQKLVCEDTDPGDPGDPGDTGDPGTPVCMFNGKDVPCSTQYHGLTWWYSGGCYFHRADPWPPEVFEDKKPEGAVYHYYCLPGAPGGWEYTWLPADPPGYGGPGVNPRDLAEQAIANMNLEPITIGIVPKPGPNSLGIVGMPTWMWVDNLAGNTFGPISVSVSAGGITVTATGEVQKIEWSMGDGTSPVVCTTAGTAYADHYGKQDSPTCGHRYEKTSWDQPDHTFTVTASSYWVVNWSGGGQSGTISLDPLEQSVDLRIGEAQVLTQ